MALLEKEHVQKVWNTIRSDSPIYDIFLKDIEIDSAIKGVVVARLLLTPIHTNSKATLHGGVSAAIVDWAGSMAVASYGLENTGLSTDIHTTYVSGAKEGEWLQIEGKASKVGATLAFTTITISKLVNMKPGVVVATGTHTKYVKQ
ncbi:MAG: hypothetical protein M1827_006289 [Pycnora praestabilis]|nr:MAG: hypothetical protein M1827_006289 [Pycnora praestabilis]